MRSRFRREKGRDSLVVASGQICEICATQGRGWRGQSEQVDAGRAEGTEAPTTHPLPTHTHPLPTHTHPHTHSGVQRGEIKNSVSQGKRGKRVQPFTNNGEIQDPGGTSPPSHSGRRCRSGNSKGLLGGLEQVGVGPPDRLASPGGPGWAYPRSVRGEGGEGTLVLPHHRAPRLEGMHPWRKLRTGPVSRATAEARRGTRLARTHLKPGE